MLEFWQTVPQAQLLPFLVGQLAIANFRLIETFGFIKEIDYRVAENVSWAHENTKN